MTLSSDCRRAIKRNVGCGLRIIREANAGSDVQLPQQKDHRELTITKEMVEPKSNTI
jgi:hypothetical protein